MKKYILENGAEVNDHQIESKYCYTCKYSHLPKRDPSNKVNIYDTNYSKYYCYKCGHKNKYEQSNIIYKTQEDKT